MYDITSSESLRQAVIQADEAVRASGKDPADVLGMYYIYIYIYVYHMYFIYSFSFLNHLDVIKLC